MPLFLLPPRRQTPERQKRSRRQLSDILDVEGQKERKKERKNEREKGIKYLRKLYNVMIEVIILITILNYKCH